MAGGADCCGCCFDDSGGLSCRLDERNKRRVNVFDLNDWTKFLLLILLVLFPDLRLNRELLVIIRLKSSTCASEKEFRSISRLSLSWSCCCLDLWSINEVSELFLLCLLYAVAAALLASWRRICLRIPARRSSTLSLIATEVSTNLQPNLAATFLASVFFLGI